MWPFNLLEVKHKISNIIRYYIFADEQVCQIILWLKNFGLMSEGLKQR